MVSIQWSRQHNDSSDDVVGFVLRWMASIRFECGVGALETERRGRRILRSGLSRRSAAVSRILVRFLQANGTARHV